MGKVWKEKEGEREDQFVGVSMLDCGHRCSFFLGSNVDISIVWFVRINAGAFNF